MLRRRRPRVLHPGGVPAAAALGRALRNLPAPLQDLADGAGAAVAGPPAPLPHAGAAGRPPAAHLLRQLRRGGAGRAGAAAAAAPAAAGRRGPAALRALLPGQLAGRAGAAGTGRPHHLPGARLLQQPVGE